MKMVIGNKIVELDRGGFADLANKYEKVVVDLGTGDGRFVYKNAKDNSKTLFIGVEPAYKQMVGFSKKVNKSRAENALFVIGTIDEIPTELKGRANELYVILPWGSLLKAVSNPTEKTIEQLKFVLNNNAEIILLFGYSEEFEPGETHRLDLENIDENTINSKLIPFYESHNFRLSEYKLMSQAELKNLESTWGKRIQQRAERKIYLIRFKFSV